MTYTTTRTWYDHAPRPVVQARYPRINVSKHYSTPEALPVGAPRPAHVDPVGRFDPIGLGLGHAGEIYRMRTLPHLYDERDVESALDLERATAMRTGHLLADCHTCKATLHVTADTDACTSCGTEL